MHPLSRHCFILASYGKSYRLFFRPFLVMLLACLTSHVFTDKLPLVPAGCLLQTGIFCAYSIVIVFCGLITCTGCWAAVRSSCPAGCSGCITPGIWNGPERS
jgi:hypothetical protein